MAKLLWGTDPEAFPGYMKDGKLWCLPPYYFRKYLGVKATHENSKHPVFIEGDGFKFHEDGAAFEMSITPSHHPRDLWEKIQEVSAIASEKILSQFPDECFPTLKFVPTIGFDIVRWENEGEDFFMATRMGCDEDWDVFNRQIEEEFDASLHPERYGGGHIHISGSPRIIEDPDLAIKMMAFTAGNAAVAYSPVPNLEKARTFRYGKPGKMRVQEYGKDNPFGPEYSVGVEYRTISDTWANDWSLAEKIFSWAEIGINILLETSLGKEILPEIEKPSINAIISADQESSREILSYIESKL